MILSHRLNTLFVHIPKNAGTSISRALMKLDRRAERHLPGLPRTKHYTALDVRDALKLDTMALNSFAVVREPCERFCSLYYYLLSTKEYAGRAAQAGSPSALALLYDEPESWLHGLHSSRPQARFLLDEKGRPIVRHIVRYEALEEGLRGVFAPLGVAPRLPRLNASERGKKDAEETLSRQARDALARHFAEDFAMFGYPVNGRS